MKNLYSHISKKSLWILFISFFTSAFAWSQPKLTVSVKTTISCKEDGTANLTVNGGNAPYSAYWVQYKQSPGGNGPDTVANGLSVTGLKPGYYMVYISDNSMPTKLTQLQTVMIMPAFTLRSKITPANCSNADGKIRVDIFDTSSVAKGPYSYEWSTGVNRLNVNATSDSISNIPAGNYSIKVTNGNGCFVKSGSGVSGSTNAEGLIVWSKSSITASTSSTPSNCFDGTAKVVPANGTAPYTYLWNTTPPQFTQTANGLTPGSLSVIVTDAKGCYSTFYVNVAAGPNYLQSTTKIIPESCNQSNGSIDLTVTGGKKPYTYSWNNGSTTQDLTGIKSGYYNVTITDSVGCKLKVFKLVEHTSPVKAKISGVAPGCGQADGQLSASITGGTAPYTYSWFPGSVNTAVYSGAKKGYYGVTVTDSKGCSGKDNFNLQEPLSCKARITGRIFNDLNGNCSLDAGEEGLENIIVKTVTGNYFATTDNLGFYAIPLDPGVYDVSIVVPKFWKQQCPQNPSTINVNAASFGTVYSGNNFYLKPDSLFNDVSVHIGSGPARPGFPMTCYITVKNQGTNTISPQLTFLHDPGVSYTGANPAPTAYVPATKTLSWNLPPLAPNATRTLNVFTKLPPTAILGDSIRSNANISIPSIDVNPSNNKGYYARLITGSYDPNDKEVLPKGTGQDGLLSVKDTSKFVYRIRFQNSGTDTAFTVVVRDTLDPSFDPGTFKFIAASHPVVYSLSGKGNLEFTFENILLPDSNVNEPASHGVIFYEINRKQNLPPGTILKNRASIYFDFNPPIHTNTTINKLYDITTGIDEIFMDDLEIIPNPSSELSQMSFNTETSEPVQILIWDLSGKLVYNQNFGTLNPGKHEFQLNRALIGGETGVYIISIQEGTKNHSTRWIVNK